MSRRTGATPGKFGQEYQYKLPDRKTYRDMMLNKSEISPTLAADFARLDVFGKNEQEERS